MGQVTKHEEVTEEEQWNTNKENIFHYNNGSAGNNGLGLGV